MTQPIKTFTHPAVARARKEAAQECARIAAEVSEAGGPSERVRELIMARFELDGAASKQVEDTGDPYRLSFHPDSFSITWPEITPKDK